MGLLDMLGYVGDTIGKPGRAVRGALGGRPEEMLAALPFSDSLGITDERNAVSGKDLLSQLGIDTGDSIGGDIAGMGVEMLTDPLSYIGAGVAAKGIRGATRGRRGFSEADDVFDLVPKGGSSVEDDIAREMQINQAFPVPTGPEPDLPSNPLVTGLTGGTGTVPEESYIDLIMNTPPGEPIQGLLHDLPPFSNYAKAGAEYSPLGYAKVGAEYGPLSGTSGSVAQDALMDGDPMTAFAVSQGAWGKILDDLSRLHPDAKAQLFGGNGYTREAATRMGLNPNVPMSEQGHIWAAEIANRRGDLTALSGMLPMDAISPSLRASIGEELDRLAKVSPWQNPSSPALRALGDIQGGHIRPSQIPEAMSDLSHLPGMDERMLRKMAADGQMKYLQDEILERITQTTRAYGADLDEAIRVPELGDYFGTRYLLDRLGFVDDPKEFARGIEPNITRKIMATPTNPELAAAMPQVKELVAMLRARKAAAEKTRGPLTQFLEELHPQVSRYRMSDGTEDTSVALLEQVLGRENATREALARRLGVDPHVLFDIAYDTENPMPPQLQRLFESFANGM